MKPASPFLTAREAADYLRLPTMNAFYCYRYKTGLKGVRRGGVLLFTLAALDASLYVETAKPRKLRKVG